MGLKQDIIKAKVEALKSQIEDSKDSDFDTAEGSAINTEATLLRDAIVDFLTKADFRVTNLKANVVLEDFKIPPQPADILSTVKTSPGQQVTVAGSVGSTTLPGNLVGAKNGSLLQRLDLNKFTTGLQSTGYVFIGEDPYTKDSFDVDDEDGQRQYTTVKLIRDDIEGLL